MPMNGEQFPLWTIALAWGWVVLIGGGSALYRKRNGKPIVPRLPSHALYAERRASGRWANNALMVAVTKDALSVTPYFPFTLGFLPELYRLEHHIPLKRIRSVTARHSVWGMNAVMRYGVEERTLKLKLPNVDAFADALAGAGVRMIRP